MHEVFLTAQFLSSNVCVFTAIKFALSCAYSEIENRKREPIVHSLAKRCSQILVVERERATLVVTGPVFQSDTATQTVIIVHDSESTTYFTTPHVRGGFNSSLSVQTPGRGERERD